MRYLPVLIFMLLSTFNVKSQNNNSALQAQKIDSVYIFEPIGYIGIDNNNKIEPNAILTNQYVKDFKGIFTSSAPYKVSFIESDTSVSNFQDEYFVKLMQRINKVENQTIQNLKISENIANILSPLPGRYFGFVCYSGFELQDPLKKIMRSNSMRVVSLLAGSSTGIWSVDMASKSYLHNYLLIVDKKTGKVVSFHKDKISRSPILVETIQKQVKVLL